MIQHVLAQPAWQGRLTARDLRALTPLKWQHFNPYGTFHLDMQRRLPLGLAAPVSGYFAEISTFAYRRANKIDAAATADVVRQAALRRVSALR